jgi:short-subunit dehydrogenase
MRSLRGKRVFITGAGRGLGRALALRFARAGSEVVVTDIDAAAAEGVARELRAAGAGATAYPLDVTDEGQVRDVRRRSLAERGPIDVLVNNAGVVFGGAFTDVPLDRHRTTVAVNLTALLTVTHAFLPDLTARPAAQVVNIASASAVIALPWAASYAASKWAVLGFTESLREELRLLGHSHVGVTAVCPCYITTGLFAGARPPRLVRWLSAEEVADATVRAVERDRELVLLPWTARLLLSAAARLPRRTFRRLCRWFGVAHSMTGWQGRPDGRA